MKSKLLLASALLFLSLSVRAVECDSVSGDYYFIEFRLSGLNRHPVIMSGLLQKIETNAFSKQNAESFIKSFFQKCI